MKIKKRGVSPERERERERDGGNKLELPRILFAEDFLTEPFCCSC